VIRITYFVEEKKRERENFEFFIHTHSHETKPAVRFSWF